MLAFSFPGIRAELTPEQVASLPKPAEHKVDFAQEVRPILETSCASCHGRGKDKGGFAIDNRETFLKGGDSGPAVLPGRSAESLLIEMVSGLNPDNVMPQKGTKLTSQQVSILRAWIDQGLEWTPEINFAKRAPVNLHPRKPALPEGSSRNPVDRFLDHYFEQHGIPRKDPVEDRLFARRAYLDVIGLLPTPEELDRFLKDPAPDKRERLVAELLNRNLDYAQHWLTFWNDALRNDYKGTGYIDGGRKQITGWLLKSLVQNKPYDQFVRELVAPTPESEGFAKGIIWRGVVNASQTPEMQAAQNISQVFMGVNLKCASCHDSFINDWTLADAYGLANVYADQQLELFHCDAPTGRKAETRFIYPELGAIDPAAPRTDRLRQLADIITSEKNGRLTRTIVNRLWARFMGRGLIEPVDEMENPAWHQDLLDWLAADLAEHNYDLKHTIATIVTSRAYQLPSVAVPERSEGAFVFAGPLVRRVSAEQFVDALAQFTGVQDRSAAARLNFAATLGKPVKTDFSDRKVQPKWIWGHDRAAQKAEATTVYFRKFIETKEAGTATFLVTADNSFKLYVNGVEAGSGKDFKNPSTITANLRAGINLVAIAARNALGAPNNPEADQSSPAGLWVYARIDAGDEVQELGSDSTWLASTDAPPGWEKPAFPAALWIRASEIGAPDAAPWRLGEQLALAVSNLEFGRHVRAALSNNDALMTALGRPNREQVVTSRPSAATTLQALELTNGPLLAGYFKKAAELLAGDNPAADKLVQDLYLRALARPPTPPEAELTLELLGSPVKREGVEDLLWAMAMLPEFQLIY